MAEYKVKAIHKTTGEVQNAIVDAPSEKDVISGMSGKGYAIESISEIIEKSKPTPPPEPNREPPLSTDAQQQTMEILNTPRPYEPKWYEVMQCVFLILLGFVCMLAAIAGEGVGIVAAIFSVFFFSANWLVQIKSACVHTAECAHLK